MVAPKHPARQDDADVRIVRAGTSLSRAEFLLLAAAAALAATSAGRSAASEVRPIETRKIPKTGEALPVIGLGTWQSFDIGRSASERAPRRQVLEALFAANASVIDSSPMYGRAEGVTGDLLAGLGARTKAFIATKVWVQGRERGVHQMEESFRQFQTDRIDLMQVHNLLDWRTHLATMRAWKEAGRFRYIGVTHYTSASLADLAAIMRAEPIDFVQMAYSIAAREPERSFLALCAEKGVAVMVNRPFESGALFGEIRGRKLPEWAAEFDCASWAQFFLKYIVSHPSVTCVIPATSKPQHMADNLGAGRGRLPDAAMRKRMVEHVRSL
jgi:diketogulonate reductase-like aldo/keto reductase